VSSSFLVVSFGGAGAAGGAGGAGVTAGEATF